jgi:hypothetical protein
MWASVMLASARSPHWLRTYAPFGWRLVAQLRAAPISHGQTPRPRAQYHQATCDGSICTDSCRQEAQQAVRPPTHLPPLYASLHDTQVTTHTHLRHDGLNPNAAVQGQAHAAVQVQPVGH